MKGMKGKVTWALITISPLVILLIFIALSFATIDFFDYISPTDPDNTVTDSRNWTYINISVTNSSIVNSFVLEWNGTNVTAWGDPYYGIWHLDDNLTTDGSGHGNDLTRYNNTLCDVESVDSYFPGGACKFDGIENGLDAPSDNWLDRDAYFEAWIKMDSINAVESNMISARNSDASLENYQFRVTTGGVLQFLMQNGCTGSYATIGSTVLAVDTWYHVAFWVDEGIEKRIYINGNQEESDSAQVTFADCSMITTIGYNTREDTEFFNGTIDEIRLILDELPTPDWINISYRSKLGRYFANVSNNVDGTNTYNTWINDTGGNLNASGSRQITFGQGCGTLAEADTTYTLTQDLSSSGTCFTIANSGITLDGNGFLINFSQSASGWGVTSDGDAYDNISIINAIIHDGGSASDAILINDADNVNITNNTIITQNSGADGISFTGSSLSNIIRNNLINVSVAEGVSLVGDVDFNIIDSNIIDNGGSASNARSAIHLNDQSANDPAFNNITFNVIFANEEGVRFVDDVHDNLIANNNISTTRNDGDGILLTDSDRNTIFNNTITVSGSDAVIISLTSGATDNLIYNNLLNSTGISNDFSDSIGSFNNWNTTLTTATNIIGGSNIGGNFYANSTGIAYSETCIDTDSNGICNDAFNITSSGACTEGTNCSITNADFLPLSLATGDITANYILPTDNNSADTSNITDRNWTYINVSVTNTSIVDEFRIEWNGTNITAWGNGLIGLWHLEADATDSSGNGNDGTITGANCTSSVTGKYGFACEFTPSGEEVNVGSADIFDNILDKTVSMWINPRSFSGNDMNLITKGGDIGSTGWVVYTCTSDPDCSSFTNTLVFAHFWDGSEFSKAHWHTPANSVTTDEWQHIIVVYNGSSTANNPIIYINGVSVLVNETEAPSGNNKDDSAQNLIFGNEDDGSESYDGFIDEIRLWNRLLTAEEIEILWRSQIGKYYANITDNTNGTYTFNAYINQTDGSEATAGARTITFGANDTGVVADITSPIVSNFQAFAINGTFDIIGGSASFNTTNLEEIEYMLINFTLTDPANISDFTLFFSSNGSGSCSLGNLQSHVCYNLSNAINMWIRFKNGTITETYDGTEDGGNQGDQIEILSVEGPDTQKNYSIRIDEHYNPNIFKWYSALYNFSDVKWQDGSGQKITKGNMIKVEVNTPFIPLNADQYKLDIRINVSSTPSTSPLLAFACNSSYTTGNPQVLSECALVSSLLSSEFTDDGTKHRGIFTKELVDALGDIKFIILDSDENNPNRYYTIKTYKEKNASHTQKWEYTEDDGGSWTNLADDYESELNINWFIDGGTPTQTMFRIESNDSLGNMGNSSNFNVTWNIDPTQNYPPIVDIKQPEINDTVSEIIEINWTTADPNDDFWLTNITILNGSGAIEVIAPNLVSTVSSFNWTTTNHANGTYNLTILSWENETSDGFAFNDTHEINIANLQSIFISDCSNLNQAGVTYKLDSSISDSTANRCMNITAADVTFNCQGNEIDGIKTTDTYGIHVVGGINTTINGCNINNWDIGISIDDSADTTVEFVNITQTNSTAIQPQRSNGTTIQNVITNSSQVYGITIWFSKDTTITDTQSENHTRYDFLQRANDVVQCHNNVFSSYTLSEGQPLAYYNETAVLDNWDDNVTQIVLCDADFSTINDVVIQSDFGNGGILLVQTDNANITNSSLNSTFRGVGIESTSHFNKVEDSNSTFGSDGFTITTTSENNTFNRLIASDSTTFGIYIQNSNSNLINNSAAYNNTSENMRIDSGGSFNIFNNATVTDGSANGIIIFQSDRNNITASTIRSTGDHGIRIDQSDNSLVNNTLSNTNTNYGIFIISSNNNLVDGSTLINNSGDGIRLQSADNNTIINTVAADNSDGFRITTSDTSDNTIRNSNATTSSSYGIIINAGDKNTIFDNRITDNGVQGMFIGSTVSDFLIYNNLLNNTDNTFFSGTEAFNNWNMSEQTGTRIFSSGTNIGGNFWATPTATGYSESCADADTDGFCDDPYNVTNDVSCTDGSNCSITNTDFLPYSDEFVAPIPSVELDIVIQEINSTEIDTTISGDPMWENQRTLVRSGNNTLHATYLTVVNELTYARSEDNGSTWSVQVLSTEVAYAPHITADSFNIVVAYAPLATGTIRLRRSLDDGITWENITTDIGASFEDQSVWLKGDNLYSIYEVNNAEKGINFSKSTDKGDNFGSQTRIFPDDFQHPGSALNGSGASDDILYAVSTNASDGSLYFAKSTDAGDTWSSPIVIVDNSTFSTIGLMDLPSVTYDGSDVHVAVWGIPTSGNNGEAIYVNSTDNGDTWSTPLRIDSNGTDHNFEVIRPIITTGLDSNIWILWEANTSFINERNIHARVKNETGDFEERIRLITNDSSENQRAMSKAIYGQNRIEFLWINTSGTDKIMYGSITVDDQDFIRPPHTFSRSIEDTLSLQDFIDRLLTMIRSSSDVIVFLDTVTGERFALQFSRSSGDVIAFSDSLLRTLNLDREISDSIIFTTVTERLADFFRFLLDLLSFTDVAEKQAEGKEESVSSVFSFADLTGRTINFQREISDSIIFTTITDRLADFFRFITDLLRFADFTQAITAGDIGQENESASDIFAFVDVVGETEDKPRSTTSVFSFADVVERAAITFQREISDSIIFTTITDRLTDFFRFLLDLLFLTDTPQSQTTGDISQENETVSDIFAFTDLTEETEDKPRSTTSVFSFADVINRGASFFNKEVSSSVIFNTVVDRILDASRFITDLLFFSDRAGFTTTGGNLTVTIDNPVNITYSVVPTLNYTIVATGNPISQCFYNINNGENITLENCENLSAIGFVGTNVLIVFVEDTASNIASDTVTFSINFETELFQSGIVLGLNLLAIIFAFLAVNMRGNFVPMQLLFLAMAVLIIIIDAAVMQNLAMSVNDVQLKTVLDSYYVMNIIGFITLVTYMMVTFIRRQMLGLSKVGDGDDVETFKS